VVETLGPQFPTLVAADVRLKTRSPALVEARKRGRNSNRFKLDQPQSTLVKPKKIVWWRVAERGLDRPQIGRSVLNVPFGTSDGAGFWFEIQSEIQTESALIRLVPSKKTIREDVLRVTANQSEYCEVASVFSLILGNSRLCPRTNHLSETRS